MIFIRRNILQFAILLVLPVIMLLPALLPGQCLLPAQMLGNMQPWHSASSIYPAQSPWNPLQFDGIAQFYPWRLFAANTLKSGYLPLWNPYQFCGTPFLANDQSAVLYPPNLIFVMMPVAKAFGASAVLHLFFTGVFLYLFVRRRASAPPALLSAIVWQLSAWQISWLALPTFPCTSAWIPLALLQVERIAEKPSLARGGALGLILGVMLFAGHLQIALYGLLLIGGYALVLLNRETADRKTFTYACLAALAIMILVSAAQILPTVELAAVSHRSGGHPSMVGYGGYVRLAMPWMNLATLIVPSFFGRSMDYWGATNYAENACFIGSTGLLLALLAVTRLFSEDLRVRTFTIVALLSLLLALGTPLNMLTYFAIPGFGQTGSPARVLALFALCGAILAGYGFEGLIQGRCPKAGIWWTIVIAILTIGGAILSLSHINPAFLDRIDLADLGVSVLLMLIAIVVLVWAHQTEKPSKVAVCTIVVVSVAELLRAGFGYNLPAADAQVYPTTPAISRLKSLARTGRILVVNQPNAVYEGPGLMPPNAATVYGLRDLQGYDSLQTRQYKEFLNTMNGGVESSPLENGNMDLTHEAAVGSDMARLAGARLIISGSPISTLGPPIAVEDGCYIYADPTALNRSRFASGRGYTTITDISATRAQINYVGSGDLVVADQWYPGWIATENDQRLKMGEGPAIFRTVRSVQGPSGNIAIHFEPNSVKVGLFGTLIGIAWLIAMTASSQYRQRSI